VQARDVEMAKAEAEEAVMSLAKYHHTDREKTKPAVWSPAANGQELFEWLYG
jgi:hypothetical protein